MRRWRPRHSCRTSEPRTSRRRTSPAAASSASSTCPPGDGPFPAVIMLQGSSGGLPVRRPKVLAADGYAVLALPYIGYTAPDGTVLPGLDAQIPLDYFGDAIRWLQAQPKVDPDRIGMYGHSLGGLATLLVAARYPQIKAAIAVSPLSITWDSSTDVSGFSFKGKPIPFVAPVLAERLIQPFYDAVASGADYRATIPAILQAPQSRSGHRRGHRAGREDQGIRADRLRHGRLGRSPRPSMASSRWTASRRTTSPIRTSTWPRLGPVTSSTSRMPTGRQRSRRVAGAPRRTNWRPRRCGPSFSPTWQP